MDFYAKIINKIYFMIMIENGGEEAAGITYESEYETIKKPAHFFNDSNYGNAARNAGNNLCVVYL